MLYALGLQVAEDFPGEPLVELFTPSFRQRNPVRTVATWGLREEAEAATSEEDDELTEELEALGYLE